MPARIDQWDGASWVVIASGAGSGSGGATGGGGGGGGSNDDRSTLVSGVDRPVRGVNCGVLANVTRTALRPANQGEYVMSTNEVLENRDIYGRVKAAKGGVMRNCRVFGTPPKSSPGINDHYPLLSLTSSSIAQPGDFLAEDCQFTPSPEHESAMAYGVKGGGGTLRRCEISRVVDGLQIWNGNMLIEQSWIGDLLAINPDVTRNDGDHTHNDGIQIEGGTGYTFTIKGNTIDVYISPLPTVNGASLLGLLSTNNMGQPANIDLIQNWWRGGSYPVNLPVPTSGRMLLDGNRFQRGQQLQTNKYWHIIAKSATQSMWTLTNNTGVHADWSHETNTIDVKAGD